MRGTVKSIRWEPDPRAGSLTVGPVEIEAFVPYKLNVFPPQPSPAVLSAAARIEARIIALQASGISLQLDGIARMLLRAEAVSSSRIEGLVMGHRRLAHAEAGRNDIDARAIVNNIHAVNDAIGRAESGVSLSETELCGTHAQLVDGDPRMARHAGSIRDTQNWIGGQASTPAGAEFVPPPHYELSSLLSDLFSYAERHTDLALIQAAVIHAQFETIHPFADGNGRVGRILIATQLVRRQIANEVIPPVSLALSGMADRYVKALTSWRFGDENDWYATFVDAMETAVDAVDKLAKQITSLREQWISQAGSPRAHSAIAALIPYLVALPVLNAEQAADVTGRSVEAARRALIQLSEEGIVKPLNLGGRKNAWEVVGVFALLDQLERDIGDPHKSPRHTN